MGSLSKIIWNVFHTNSSADTVSDCGSPSPWSENLDWTYRPRLRLNHPEHLTTGHFRPRDLLPGHHFPLTLGHLSTGYPGHLSEIQTGICILEILVLVKLSKNQLSSKGTS